MWFISVLSWFVYHKHLVFSPTVFFKECGWCTCTSARIRLSPQRGRGWLNHDTEMKDDEWLIKEERWMTLNVMTASSVQSKQNMCGSAFLHIGEQLSHRCWQGYFYVSTQKLKLDYISVFQVMRNVFRSFSFAGVLKHHRLSAHCSFLISSRLCSYTHQCVCVFHHTFSA